MEKQILLKTLEVRNILETDRIVESLTAEMGLYYFNNGAIDMNAHVKSLVVYLENEDLTSNEKHIAYQIIADIEDMIKYREEHPDI